MEEVVSEVWGSEARIQSWIPNGSDEEKGYQYASELQAGKLTLEVGVLVKRQPAAELRRTLMNSNLQFHNEFFVYSELLPLMSAKDFTPKMFYGKATLGENPDDDIIVLEFLKKHKVHKGPFLKEEYLKAALQKLGEFHSCSYKNQDKIRIASKNLKNVGFTSKPVDTYENWLRGNMMRGITPLVPIYDELKELVKILEMDFESVIWFLEKGGSEKVKVLCHGDFCSNNMLFSESLNVKFIDLQTSVFASPAIDLAFFLYLNTSPSVREKCWDELLITYTTSLSGVHPAELLKEFASRSLYGYLHCAFFLPIMLCEDESPWNEETLMNKCPEEQLTLTLAFGGQEATDYLVSIVKHQVDKGYIKEFLKEYEASKQCRNQID